MSDMDGVMMSGTIQKCHGMVYLSHISNTGKSNWKIYERERERENVNLRQFINLSTAEMIITI